MSHINKCCITKAISKLLTYLCASSLGWFRWEDIPQLLDHLLQLQHRVLLRFQIFTCEGITFRLQLNTNLTIFISLAIPKSSTIKINMLKGNMLPVSCSRSNLWLQCLWSLCLVAPLGTPLTQATEEKRELTHWPLSHLWARNHEKQRRWINENQIKSNSQGNCNICELY